MEKYVVNVSNIGNMGFTNKSMAVRSYRQYVRDSKKGHGHCGMENVCLMIDGEPCMEFNWLSWIISRQEARVITAEKNVFKEKQVLWRLLRKVESE